MRLTGLESLFTAGRPAVDPEAVLDEMIAAGELQTEEATAEGVAAEGLYEFLQWWDAEHPEEAAAAREANDRYLAAAADAERLSAQMKEAGVASIPKGGMWIRFLCGDCRGGQTIAHVTIQAGRPLLWCRQDDGTGSRQLADVRGAGSLGWGDYAYCRARHQYTIPVAVLGQILEHGHGRRAVAVLSHAGHEHTTLRYR